MSFNEITNRIQQRIDTKVRAATVGVFSSVIRMTPVGNPDLWQNTESAPEGYVGGRARGNWQCTIGSPANGDNWQSNSEGATIATVPQHAGAKVYLTNNLPYIQKLEYGHSTQAPAGMVRISIDRFEGLMQ